MADAGDQDKRDGEDHKNSCTYSVDLAKQFLTYAAAGLAFVIASVLTPPTHGTWLGYTSFGTFGASILFGLLFVMSVVGHISRSSNYDVYTPLLRWFSALQIAAFVIGVVCVATIVLQKANSGGSSPSLSDSSLEIVTPARRVHQIIPPGSTVHLRSIAPNDLDISVQTPRK